MKVIDVMVKEKMASSKSEARRLIEQGGVKLNGKVVTSIEEEIEPGTLQVGKRKFLDIRNFAQSNANFSTGGYLHVSIKTHEEKPSNEKINLGISEAVAGTIMLMSRKNYLSGRVSIEYEDLQKRLYNLLSEGLITVEEEGRGWFSVDLQAEGYIGDEKSVLQFVKQQADALKEVKKSGSKNSMFTKLTCPRCGNESLRYSYNDGLADSPNELFNANGVCDSYGCEFKFNHLV